MGNIEFTRIWEDTDFFEIECIASSEIVHAKMNTYVTDQGLDELAVKLDQFINQRTNEITWGTSQKGDKTTPDLVLTFSYKDRSRHIRVEIYMELDDGGSYANHNCCFYIDGFELSQIEHFIHGLDKLKKSPIGTKIAMTE